MSDKPSHYMTWGELQVWTVQRNRQYGRRHNDTMGYGQPDLGKRAARRVRRRRKGVKLGLREGYCFAKPHVPRCLHWRYAFGKLPKPSGSEQ